MLAGAAGSLLGSIVSIAAPGNFVRITETDARPILFQVLNQIPATLMMALYMIPVFLILVLAARLLFLESARRRQAAVPAAAQGAKKPYVLVLFVLLCVVSFFTGNWLGGAIERAIVFAILSPIGLTDDKTISHLDNTMAGFEEYSIYIFAVILLYRYAVARLGLAKRRIRTLRGSVTWRMVYEDFPEVRYALFLAALSVFNNLVVMGAPTFPGRALFSSAVLLLIGTVAILRIPCVKAALLESREARSLRSGLVFLAAFFVIATLSVLHAIWQEDAKRVAYIHAQSKLGVMDVHVPPTEIPLRRRILRHVYYDDYDTGQTRGFISYYFGIGTVTLDPSMRVKDLP